MNKHVTDFTIRLKSITTIGSLYGLQKTEKAAAKSQGKAVTTVYCTPDGRPVSQVYVPTDTPDNGEQFYTNQLEKAIKNEDGTLTLVGKENVKTVKQEASGLPQNVLNLSVHEEDDLDGQVWPAEKRAYVFIPHDKDAANVQWHNLILDLVVRSGKAFCGMAVVKTSNDAFYRLQVWRGHLVLVQQVPPEFINPFEAVEPERIAASTFQKALNAVNSMVTPFDPDTYKNTSIDAMAAFAEQAAKGEVSVDTKVSITEPEAFDMDAALDGFADI